MNVHVSAFDGEFLEAIRRKTASVVAPALAMCLAVGVAERTEAATVMVEGTKYEISTVVGTFDSLESTLNDQPWWGQSSLASDFSFALGGALGYPNPPVTTAERGPIFAYAAGSTQFQYRAVTTVGAAGGFQDRDITFTFAIGEELAPVPLPATLPLLLVGAGALAMIRRRR